MDLQSKISPETQFTTARLKSAHTSRPQYAPFTCAIMLRYMLSHTSQTYPPLLPYGWENIFGSLPKYIFFPTRGTERKYAKYARQSKMLKYFSFYAHTLVCT